jgi:peptide/nickel transport system substrate-binding protein
LNDNAARLIDVLKNSGRSIMRRRDFLAATAAALAAPAVGRAHPGRVLKWIPQTDLTVLDPVWTTAYITRTHSYLVFDLLYGQRGPAGDDRCAPQMVAGQVVENDGKTWTLTLRDGLLFHDGQRVLARDCVASIKRWGARDVMGQTLMQRVDDLSVSDDRTIVFRLKRPFPMLPEALGKITPNPCVIMPERLASTDPFKQVTEMVGSGPFRFREDEHVHGSLVVYERFRDYEPRASGTPDYIRPKDCALRSHRMARHPRPRDSCGGPAGGRDGWLGAADRRSAAVA